MRVAIIGASTNPAKFGHKAVRAYLRRGHDVFPVNPHAQEVAGLPAYARVTDIPGGPLDRVLLYVPPEIGVGLLEDIAAKGVDEVWINPGAESEELFRRAAELGLRTIYACAILDIGEHPSAI